MQRIKKTSGQLTMILYIDTEFTDLFDADAKLISAGFVTSDGKEFYFELTDNYEKRDCSKFVIDEILPHLNHNKHGMTAFDAGDKLKSWIESFGEAMQMASDAPDYDFPLIAYLFKRHHCWPVNLDSNPVNVSNYLIEERIERYFEYQPMAIRHHALWDARALVAACNGPIDE